MAHVYTSDVLETGGISYTSHLREIFVIIKEQYGIRYISTSTRLFLVKI